MTTRYSYKAIDSHGNEVNSFMEAETTEEVGMWLADRGYVVEEVTVAPLHNVKNSFFNPIKYLIFGPPISEKDMNLLLIQLANLINSGCPLLMSLTALSKQISKNNIKLVLTQLREKIESGKSFSEALKAHTDVFPSLLITMVEVGEIGGLLDEVLTRYSHIFDAKYRLKSKCINSMIYPFILLCCTIFVVWALLVLVFPVFIEGTTQKGHSLPAITQFVLDISNFLSGYWPYIILSGFALIYGFCQIMNTRKGNLAVTSVLMHTPILDSILKSYQVAIFARILGTLLRCGVPILTSLQAVEKALSNIFYKDSVAETREFVSRGESLSKSLGKYRNLYPESLILMSDVGERSGNIGEMLEKAGEVYERDIEMKLETAVVLLQPALIAIMGIIIVTIAFAMYMPLFDIIKTVG